MRRQHAFTYIELLVVIAIIGVLVALLLPAVQAAREAARRLQCSNNLAQVILAVHQYESAHQVYPPGTIDAQGPIVHVPRGYHHNWISQILPYLEQQPLARHVDYRVGVYDPANKAPRALDMAVLRCPSSPAGGGRGHSDYAGIHHSGEAPIDVDNNGVFFLNSRIRFDDVIDGVSSTIFMGEKATILGDLGWMSGTRATLRNLGSINGVGNRIPWATGYPPGVDEDYEKAPKLADEALSVILFPATSSNPRFNVDPAPYAAVPPQDLSLAVGAVSSVHPGGAQFALGSGGVRFVAETIDVKVRHQLGNRADRTLSGSDDYW